MERIFSRLCAVVAYLVPLVPFSVFFIPSIPAGALVAIVYGVLALAIAVVCLYTPLARMRREVVAIALVLPAVSLAASIYVGMPAYTIFDLGFEIGTVGSYVLFALAICAGAFVSRRGFLYAFSIATILFSFFAAGVHAVVPESIIGIEIVRSSFQISLLSMCALVAQIAYIQTRTALPVAGIAAAALLLIASALFFSWMAVLIGIGAMVIVSAVQYMWSSHSARVVPIYSIVVVVALVAIAVFGLHRTPAADPLVRSTAAADMLAVATMIRASMHDALLGYGPHSYATALEAYSRTKLYAGPEANYVPQEGASTLSTLFIEVGLLGALAFVGIAIVSFAAVRGRVQSDMDLWIPCSIVLFFFASAIFSIAGTWLWYLGAVALGMTASGHRDNVAHENSHTRIGVVAVLAALSAMLIWVGAHQIAAASAHAKANALSRAKDLYGAYGAELRAVDLWGAPQYKIAAAQRAIEFVTRSPQDGGAGNQALAQQTLDQALARISGIRSQQERSYDVTVSLARLYIQRGQLGYEDAYSEASILLKTAQAFSPSSFEPFFLQAVILELQGKRQEAYLLTLKILSRQPDYPAAQTLLSRLKKVVQ